MILYKKVIDKLKDSDKEYNIQDMKDWEVNLSI